MTRSNRTNHFRNLVEKQWHNKYWTFIIDNPDKPWDWNWISRNTNITWDIIKANPDIPWDWEGISWNPNITMDIIRDNPDNRGIGLVYLIIQI